MKFYLLKMGKKKLHKKLVKKLQKKAIKLAMDCTWNEEGRCLRNKDEPVHGVGKIKEKMSEM
jgi:hypothetical protein